MVVKAMATALLEAMVMMMVKATEHMAWRQWG